MSARWWTTASEGLSFRKFSSVTFVSATSEQEWTTVLSFHSCCRGGHCKHLLLSTVLVLAIDSCSPFNADILPSLSHTQYSCFKSFISVFWVSCSHPLICVFPHHGLQPLITDDSIDLDGFPVRPLPMLFGVDQTFLFTSSEKTVQEYFRWELHL